MPSRFAAVAAVEAAPASEFAADVAYYLSLTPRQLPSRYLYDDLGSVLFDAICRLPWYPITRAEMRLLRAHGDEILAGDSPFANIVELGPGNGEKLRLLLESSGRRTPACTVHLVDASESALAAAARAIEKSGVLRVFAQRAAYETGLRVATAAGRGRTLVIFLGSNIGNFDPPGAAAFFQNLRACLRPGDALLLGVDLVKPSSRLLLAYDDPLGVTAAFNRNLLVRINRELDAHIDIDDFQHRAVWNAGAARVEMHLVARRPQVLCIHGSGTVVDMSAGESIWTESSYKFRPEQVEQQLRSAGFTSARQWIDREDRCALTLAEV